MEALESELLGTLERAEVLIVQQQAKMKQLEQKLHDLVATNTEDDAAKDATAKLRERVAALLSLRQWSVRSWCESSVGRDVLAMRT